MRPRSPRRPVVRPASSTTSGPDFDPLDIWTARAGRRNSREKFAAGLRGLKHAIRGDSSFFAHGYRGILIAMTAGLLGVKPLGLVPARDRGLHGAAL